jgi:hypothetical protein
VNLLRGFIDRVLLVGAVIGGGLVPGFIAQYRQRLGGRFDQVRLDLDPWQRIADQFYRGSLEQLVQFHLASSDATVHSEGAVLQALLAAERRLQAAVDAMQGGLWEQLGYLALHPDPELARAALSDWVPSFALSAEGLSFAFAFALVAWLGFQLVWWLGATAYARRFGHPVR